EADGALADLRAFASRTADPDVLLQAAVLSGRAAIDCGRLSEAEHTLRIAAASAHGLGEVTLANRARLMLARGLFWGGRYANAIEVLDAIDRSTLAAEERVDFLIERARAALGLGDVRAAIATAAEARTAASAIAAPLAVARAAAVSTLVHL